MTRSKEKANALRSDGIDAVIADGLDANAVLEAMMKVKPDAVIHEMTSIAGVKSLRNFDREFALTNRLRTKGTDHLIEAAHFAGVRRIVAQSYGGWTYAPTGSALKTESDALDPAPPANQQRTLDAIRYLESRVTGSPDFDGVALRYANFYGPCTGFDRSGNVVALIRKRMLPIVGNGAGVWSFIHIEDAAHATAAAVERAAPGVYNIVDNEPAPVSVWLPELAKILDVKGPMHIPAWLGRLVIGDVGVSMMTQMRGMSNEKAVRELGWKPKYKTWRDGFRGTLVP